MTQVGGVDIFWTGSRLHEISSHLPPVNETISGVALVPWRYHFNTVTFSYTAAFYDFDQWSLLLDWMALRGINLPLAWVGYEHTLIQVFLEAGLSDTEISDFLSGPAFQAWNRFGNIQGNWGGPLPVQWVDDQFALQKQIIQRMAELGMTPVLPAFTGFVPRAMHNVYPNASIVNGTSWAGIFPSNLSNDSFLEPFDPLFASLQKSFINIQKEAFGGVSHIYTLDQYNENNPFSGDVDYLHNVSSNTFNSLRAADPEAVWLMQGWLFFAMSQFWNLDRISAYLDGVPGNDSMIILDLYSEAQAQWLVFNQSESPHKYLNHMLLYRERTSSYLGKPWVWCALHDFGGNMGFEGNLMNVTAEPLRALQSPGSTMRGIGLTMEGQEGNELVYDILLDQAWSTSPIDISRYVSSWVSRRYLLKSLPESAQMAWEILAASVYNNTDVNSLMTLKSIVELPPTIDGPHPPALFYDSNATVVVALRLLVEASKQNEALRAVPEFAHDVVDVARQVMVNRFIDFYDNLREVYTSNNSSLAVITAACKPLLAIISDLDDLLMTNDDFLLSNWIGDARARASGNSTYAAYLEYNARNQITLWGPDGEINDYASKQWGGLVGSYYRQRWEAFTTYLQDTKRQGQAYNETFISQQMLSIGKVWDTEIWGDREGESWGTRGDTWGVVDKILSKWV